MFLLVLAACSPESVVTGGPSADDPLIIEISQGNDTPVRRVRWSTPEPSTGAVEFGVDGREFRVEDEALGTDHDVIVAGIGAGQDWQLEAISEADASRWTSGVIAILADDAPADLPLPALARGEASAGKGFTLTPIRADTAVRLAAYDAAGRAAWWSEPFTPRGFRGRYTPDTAEMTWLASVQGSSGREFVTSTLDGETRTVPAPDGAHQDFVVLADGSFLVLVLEERTFEGIVVSGESLDRVAVDGSSRKVWSSWDRWTWDGTGKADESGSLEWPHANGLYVNAAETKAWVSLFFPNSVVEINLATGHEDAVLGGSFADWTTEGEGFAGQHSPFVSDDGRSMWIMDNGLTGRDDVAQARGYALDPGTRTATETLVFDDGAAHTGVLLGDVVPLADGGTFVSWGTAGVLQTLDGAGVVDWQLDFDLGSYPMLTEHLADLGAGPLNPP